MVVSSPQCGEKYSLFLRFSPWRDPRLRHFSGYPFGTSRKKVSTVFYNTALGKGGSPSNRSGFGIRSPSRGMRKGIFLWKGCHVKKWLCRRKWLMLFSLKSKRINRQNALAVDSANRKLEKKAVFSLYCRNKAILCHDRAKKICVLGAL